MRCDAREDCVGSCESAASADRVGGPTDDCAPAPPASAIAARAAAAQPLAKRSAALLIEEVQVPGIDGDRHAVAQAKLHVRRERRDEVRPRADDAGLVLAR